MYAVLLLAAVATVIPQASGGSPSPLTWPAYQNRSCHAVGPHARWYLNNATHAECAAECATRRCLCFDMLDGEDAGGCRGTIDGVVRTSTDRLAYTNSTVPPLPPPGPPRPPPPPQPSPPSPPSPLEIKYSLLLNKTCGSAAQAVPELPSTDANNFLAAYRLFNGTQNETDVIKLAGVLLNRPDVIAFITGNAGGTVDTNLVLCSVLFEGTPAGLAAFAGQGESEEALLDSLFADTVLMRDMLLAGGAKGGMYGQAMSIYSKLLNVSSVLTAESTGSRQDIEPWDDRTQNKTAIMRRLALGTSVEHAVPVVPMMKQLLTPPWGPTSDPNITVVDPVKRFLHFENAYLAGDLDPAFEVLTAFEMRHITNSPATDSDLVWLRETIANTRPDNIAEPERGNGLADYSWRYSMAVHTDVGYGHPACDTSPGICTGHYTQIPAASGECGPRAFFGRLTRRAFGLPVWGCTQPGHAAMTSWSPKGWSVMLGANWQYCWWSHGDKTTQGGLDFVLDTQSRELRSEYEKILRGGWAANALGEQPIDHSWSTRDNKGYGKGGLWNALMLYQKKAVVAAASFANGTSAIPSRHVGPSIVPTKVSALIAKWPTKVSTPNITIDAKGTMLIPAVSFESTTSTAVEVMKSADSGQQLLHADDNPNTSAVAYEITMDEDSLRYLTVNYSTWHVDQYLMLTINAAQKTLNIPIYYTIGYWNESQPVAVQLMKGTNTLTFTRESFAPPLQEPMRMEGDIDWESTRVSDGPTLYKGISIKEFFLYKFKPDVRPPPANYTPHPVPNVSDYILETPTTSCVRQGIVDVPAEFCGQACAAVGNNRKFAGSMSATNVSGCFVFTSGPQESNCYFNSNTSAACNSPPCTINGIVIAEICLRK